MMRRMLEVGAVWTVALAFAVALAAAPAGAQAPAHDGLGTAAQAQGPAADVQTTTPQPQTQATPAPETTGAPAPLLRPSAAGAQLLAPAQAKASGERQLVHQPAYYRRSGVPLMIVGGAMFLAGAIIDDRAGDALMVAGVVVAAIGLYQYLQ